MHDINSERKTLSCDTMAVPWDMMTVPWDMMTLLCEGMTLQCDMRTRALSDINCAVYCVLNV